MMKMSQNNQRSREFLECMGNGQPIHQLEADNDYIGECIFGEVEDE